MIFRRVAVAHLWDRFVPESDTFVGAGLGGVQLQHLGLAVGVLLEEVDEPLL